MTAPAAASNKRPADSPMASLQVKKQKDNEANSIPDGLDAKQVEIYKRNATESPLFRLPAEIRNRIYHHAIGCNNIFPYRILVDDPINLFVGTYGKQKNMTNWDDLFSLLPVCRQLHSETKLLPWKINAFEVGFKCDFNEFIYFLAEEKKDLIKTVAFVVKRDCRCRGCQEGPVVPAWLQTCKNLTKLICSKDYPSTDRAAVEKYARQRGLRFEIGG